MKLKDAMVLFFPNEEEKEYHLEKRAYFVPYKTSEEITHEEIVLSFLKEHSIPFAKEKKRFWLTQKLLSLQIAVFYFSGISIDQKYFGMAYLPNKWSEKMIEFLEQKKEEFEMDFFQDQTMFSFWMEENGKIKKYSIEEFYQFLDERKKYTLTR